MQQTVLYKELYYPVLQSCIKLDCFSLYFTYKYWFLDPWSGKAMI